MGPIDYSLDVATPFASVLEGYKAGAGIRNDQQQQAQLKVQLDQQAKQANVLQQLLANKNPTAEDYANASVLVPGLKDQFKQAWDMRSAAQQQTHLSEVAQYFAAVKSGKPEIAADLMAKRADAMEASGLDPREIQALRAQAQLVKDHPDFAGSVMGMMLSSLPGGDKVISSVATLGAEKRADDKAPSDLRKAEAEATTAEVAAGNAPTKTELDNEKAAQDIKTAEAKRRIDELNVQIGQADSETKRGQLVLERDKWQAELDKTKTGTSQGIQDKIDNISQTLDTVKSVMKHPGLSKGTGMGGDFAAWFNGTDAADFRAQVETLKSQQFLSSVATMKGTGALSDAEGARLERAIASLDTKQSPEAFKNALGVIKTTLEKAQAKLIASGQAPTSGGTVILDHPVYGKIKDGDVNRLMAKYPGSTREQVLNYLKQTSTKGSGATGVY